MFFCRSRSSSGRSPPSAFATRWRPPSARGSGSAEWCRWDTNSRMASSPSSTTRPNGSTRGGVPFTQGPLFYLLRNRFYIGEVLYKGEICPGPQPPLIDRELFEAVQRRLTEQRTHHVTTRTKNDAPLKGILFDAAGDPMVPTHATKQGVRYRYYVSQPYLRGLATPLMGAIVRVPAPDIEAVVSKALSEYLARSNTRQISQTSGQWSLASKSATAIWRSG